MLPPALTLVTPSSLTMARSATRVTGSVSVAVLLAGVGSTMPEGAETVAVLAMLPLAPPATVAGTV